MSINYSKLKSYSRLKFVIFENWLMNENLLKKTTCFNLSENHNFLIPQPISKISTSLESWWELKTFGSETFSLSLKTKK